MSVSAAQLWPVWFCQDSHRQGLLMATKHVFATRCLWEGRYWTSQLHQKNSHDILQVRYRWSETSQSAHVSEGWDGNLAEWLRRQTRMLFICMAICWVRPHRFKSCGCRCNFWQIWSRSMKSFWRLGSWNDYFCARNKRNDVSLFDFPKFLGADTECGTRKSGVEHCCVWSPTNIRLNYLESQRCSVCACSLSSIDQSIGYAVYALHAFLDIRYGDSRLTGPHWQA